MRGMGLEQGLARYRNRCVYRKSRSRTDKRPSTRVDGARVLRSKISVSSDAPDCGLACRKVRNQKTRMYPPTKRVISCNRITHSANESTAENTRGRIAPAQPFQPQVESRCITARHSDTTSRFRIPLSATAPLVYCTRPTG